MTNFKKPACKLIGTDGNVFALIGKASRALNKAGYSEQSKEMSKKIFNAGSYEEALTIIGEYVEIE